MPLIRTIQINEATKVGIWKLSEPEDFFRNTEGIREEITHPHKRLQHLAGRRLISILEPDIPMRDIRITKSGKPHLPRGEYEFSISHSKNFVVAILSHTCRVGIDVEKISPQPLRVASKFLNRQEQQRITTDKSLKWYTLYWSAKEAVYKWYGQKGIDFKANIHLLPFEQKKEGMINCRFQKDSVYKDLHLNYRTNDEFVLVWVAEGRF